MALCIFNIGRFEFCYGLRKINEPPPHTSSAISHPAFQVSFCGFAGRRLVDSFQVSREGFANLAGDVLEAVAHLVDIIPSALRKLDLLARAHALIDLRAPPGNRLEALKGDWEGFYSIRINDQYRVVFRWEGHDASEVVNC
jgi:plasmid maintenance system killer protein